MNATGLTVIALDEQSTHNVELAAWQSLAEQVLTNEGVDGFCELNLTFVGAAEMAQLNSEHMSKEGPTDVLSFPLDDEIDPTTPHDMPRLLGDVLICPEVVAAQAPDSPDDEMALMVVHGVLHILGMDHQEPDEEAQMKEAEQRHLSSWRNGR